MRTGKNWQLHHDNAPAHSAHLIKVFLAKNNTALVRQPPTLLIWHHATSGYSPSKKGTRFWSRKNIMEKTTVEIKSILEEGFKGASKSGRGAGKSVHTFKGSILKEIKQNL